MAQINTLLSESSSHDNVSQLICIYDDVTLQVGKLAIVTRGSILPFFKAQLYESDGKFREAREGTRDTDLNNTSLSMRTIIKRGKERIVPNFRVLVENTWTRQAVRR